MSPLDRARLRETNLLDLVPVRMAAWSESDNRVVIERPGPRNRGLRGVSERLSHWLAPRRLRLDELGSYTWRRLDGRTAVGEIADDIRKRFGEKAEPVEERVALFICQLWREGFLAYPELEEGRGLDPSADIS